MRTKFSSLLFPFIITKICYRAHTIKLLTINGQNLLLFLGTNVRETSCHVPTQHSCKTLFRFSKYPLTPITFMFFHTSYLYLRKIFPNLSLISMLLRIFFNWNIIRGNIFNPNILWGSSSSIIANFKRILVVVLFHRIKLVQISLHPFKIL
jgi:hypothetical protein